MDLESFYKAAPKPNASRRSILNPAQAKTIIVKDGEFAERVMFSITDDGPISLSTPEMKPAKRMAVENFDAMIEQIFDMV